jgi:predicted outer membrane repeat protein
MACLPRETLRKERTLLNFERRKIMKREIIISALCFGLMFLALLTEAKAATRTVDTTSDADLRTCNNATPNDCSLRGAILGAASGDTINFDSSLNGATITVGSIIKSSFRSMTIAGPGADKLTISGGNTTGIMDFLQPFGPLNISGLTLINGNGVGGFNGGRGGALQVTVCPQLTIDGVVFRDNSAALNGGAIYCLQSSCRLSNSTFYNNTAGSAAAVYFTSGGTLEIINTTVTLNRDTGGGSAFGAVMLGSGSAVIRNSTIANNSGLSNIYVGTDAGSLNIGNTIVAGGASSDIWRRGTTPITSMGGNLIGKNTDAGPAFPLGSPNANGDYVGAASNQINPLLSPLANYGGTTPTLALLPNSPALNRGNNCVVNNSCAPPMPSGLTTDQRGAARQVGAQVDIGAFERNIAFDQNSLPNGTVQAPYNQQLTVTRILSNFGLNGFEEASAIENFAPFTFETVPPTGATGLPPGLVLETNGQLHGTPTTAGTYSFFIKAIDQADGMAGVIYYTLTIAAPPPTAATVSVSGRIFTLNGAGLQNARVILTDSGGSSRTSISSSFGYYRFDNVTVGEIYILSVSSKRYQFSPQVVNVMEEINELNFSAAP